MSGVFDDFMEAGHAEALEIFGTEAFTITGSPLEAPLVIQALLNEVGTTEELTLNGRKISFNAILQVAVSEFPGAAPKAGQQVVRGSDSRSYRIVGEVHRDNLTFTFPLETIHQ